MPRLLTPRRAGSRAVAAGSGDCVDEHHAVEAAADFLVILAHRGDLPCVSDTFLAVGYAVAGRVAVVGAGRDDGTAIADDCDFGFAGGAFLDEFGHLGHEVGRTGHGMLPFGQSMGQVDDVR